MGAKHTSILDVAKRAGVSTTTVSRVINGIKTVKDLHRVRVEEAIKELNYKPNVSAQRLAGGRQNTFGLVIPNFDNIFTSFLVSEVIKGVGIGAQRYGKDILLHVNSKDENSSDYRFINTSMVEGMLFAEIYKNSGQLNKVLEENIPVVVINNIMNESKISYVGIDNEKASEEAVDYLIKLGHTNIATITGDMESQSAILRLRGYKEALKKHNINQNRSYIVNGDFKKQTAKIVTHQLLALNPIPTAIFVASDIMAIEAIKVILENGLRVPEDISVIGFDDAPIDDYSLVSLTTVRQSLLDMGIKAVDILSKLISMGEGAEPIRVILPTEIIKRKSCTKRQ